MAVPTNLNAEPKNTEGFRIITIAVIIGVVLIFTLALVFYVVNYNYNIKAANVFEKAYQKIIEFDKQTNVYSKQEMEKEIMPLLDEVIADYSMSSSSKRALFYKAYVQFYTENYENSIKSFKYFIDKYKVENLVEKSYYLLSYAYENTGKVEDAINTLKVFDVKYKNSYFASLSYYRLGFLYEKKGNNKLALEYYQKVVDIKGESSQKVNAGKKIVLLKNDIKL
jgi:tetratricopeptide (TPR) repeat protein